MAAAAEAAEPAQQKARKPGVSRRQRLEVPRESSLVKQLRLSGSAISSPAEPTAQRPAIAPPAASDLLGRLQQFLPAMQSANAQLATAPATGLVPAAMDIKFRDDDITDEDSDGSAAEPHIVMDLACGVFDLKDDAALAAAARQVSSAGGGMSLPGGGDQKADSSSSSSSDEEADDSETSDDGENNSVSAAVSHQQAKQSGPLLSDAQQQSSATKGSGKAKRRRGRHQGIQEL